MRVGTQQEQRYMAQTRAHVLTQKRKTQAKKTTFVNSDRYLTTILRTTIHAHYLIMILCIHLYLIQM